MQSTLFRKTLLLSLTALAICQTTPARALRLTEDIAIMASFPLILITGTTTGMLSDKIMSDTNYFSAPLRGLISVGIASAASWLTVRELKNKVKSR